MGVQRVAPDGWSFPRIVLVRGGQGWAAGKDLVMGATVDTGRTVHPGDRIVISCHADDPHGRELRWWPRPFNRPLGGQVCGSTVELTWHVHPASVGERLYLGIGMPSRVITVAGLLLPPTRPVHAVPRYPSNAGPTGRNEPGPTGPGPARRRG